MLFEYLVLGVRSAVGRVTWSECPYLSGTINISCLLVAASCRSLSSTRTSIVPALATRTPLSLRAVDGRAASVRARYKHPVAREDGQY